MKQKSKRKEKTEDSQEIGDVCVEGVTGDGERRRWDDGDGTEATRYVGEVQIVDVCVVLQE